METMCGGLVMESVFESVGWGSYTNSGWLRGDLLWEQFLAQWGGLAK